MHLHFPHTFTFSIHMWRRELFKAAARAAALRASCSESSWSPLRDAAAAAA
eukprot:m.30209 g.30209  ORF g.30209 m.30209 type:complete len:51 (-) comp10539_c0_seq2:111-263(-)